ncbi:hypothetical protein [Flaviaesturariibacter amylovorans]|uniref:Uncharacterized protein n=1 Tax=Flaviaesturariibacter amylovorans TaxID=1084520 RepID=A0ABP8HB91_9BACT
MQLLEIQRQRNMHGIITYQIEMVAKSGQSKFRSLSLWAPAFADLIWDCNTERFSHVGESYWSAAGNSDLDRIERWIEDVFDDFPETEVVHPNAMIEHVFAGVTAKENQFRARFTGEFRRWRRLTHIKGVSIGGPWYDGQPASEYFSEFQPIPGYPEQDCRGVDDLPF